jgi:adenine-specific DNA-methyltransferase
MNPDFPQRLQELVDRAKELRRQGIHGVDPEALTKQQLIEPLFQELGYDLKDDVKHEFHILGDQCDYLLQTRRPLLFVEAKSIADKSKDLFDKYREQVLRYLRNYRVSPEVVSPKMERPVTWLLLTNFAQLHFIRVNEEAPTFSFRFDELERRADEIWELLAPGRLEAGRIEELYDQEQKADLDQRFLVDLKQWRLILANGFGIRNQNASLADLTSASQQLLDRFLFCRMLETHDLIEYNKLARAFVGYEQFFGDHSPKTFADFLRESLFEEIRKKFNTELFVQPQLCDTLQIDNVFLSAIIGHTPLPAEVALTCGIEQGQGQLFTFRHLYSYDFSRMSHDIMGAVYERFLAHRLEQKNGRITIEETNELRRKEGIYYTPRYIVDYLIADTLGTETTPIVEAAVALLLEKRYPEALTKIRELAQLKVLDPSMGSGSFLLRAFDHLLECYMRYNRACRDIKQTGRIRETPGELFGKGNEVAEEVFNPAFYIPLENIFGVDLDPQAVELARLNLWMRLMIAERDLMRERLRTRQANGGPLSLLPSLASNLKRGNSLISDPAITGDAAFEWQKEFPEIMDRGGFDVVVGNPPYERIQTMAEYAPQSLEFLKANYRTARAGNFDIYVCFVEKGLSLLRDKGLFGYILPNKFFKTDYGESLRSMLSEQRAVKGVVDFGSEQVFAATTYTCLLFLTKKRSDRLRFAESTADERALNEAKFSIFEADILGSAVWLFSSPVNTAITAKLQKDSKRLLDLPTEISRGSSSGDDEVFMIDANDSQIECDILRQPIFASDFKRYAFAPSSRWRIVFPYVREKEGFRLYTEAELKAKFPNAYAHLLSDKARLVKRKQFSEWYSFSAPRNLEVHDRCQILIPLLANHGMFAPVPEELRGSLCPMASGGFTVTISNKCALHPNFVLGLLNSRLLFWKLREISNIFRGGWITCTKQYFGELPIRTVNFSTQSEKRIYDHIVAMVGQVTTCHSQLLKFSPLLSQKIHHEHRTPCSLGHYLQKDYAGAVTPETLINDVMRKGFLHKIDIASDNATLVLSAHISAKAKDEPEIVPVLRLRFAHASLRQFVYAGWQQFLTENARRRRWTTGRQPEEIYRRIVNTEEPLVFFHAGAVDNLRAITSLLEGVAAEAGVSDLAALEKEIKETDEKIDKLVYELYELTPEEIAVVEAQANL